MLQANGLILPDGVGFIWAVGPLVGHPENGGQPWLPILWDNAPNHSGAGNYSQRNTFAETAVQIANTTTSATMSPMCADHASPFRIPSRSDTA